MYQGQPRQLRFNLLIFIAMIQAFACIAMENAASETIPWSEIGAKAGANYKGSGLSVTAFGDRARLRCVFQQLDCEATSEGLWLTSTVSGGNKDQFRVRADTVGRTQSEKKRVLAKAGNVELKESLVRYVRPGLIEEYTTTMDGVRQDFVVVEKPEGGGELQLHLEVTGAKVESASFGARLVLENSNRKIAYSRLRVTDMSGRELTSRIEAQADKAAGLAIVVNDNNAKYPIRIDPTFSDENWISLGGNPGVDRSVRAAVVDNSGNLYIGGLFTAAGEVNANCVAKWDGSSWSALGSGIKGSSVRALAVSGSNLYAGGYFTIAEGSVANYISKWDGNSWSQLGFGLGGDVLSDNIGGVYALAVLGGDLYVGGIFTAATNSNGVSVNANRVAKWNGNNWSELATGMDSYVYSLAVSGSDLYAAGHFTVAGGTAANRIAKWNGTAWSALASGMNDTVLTLKASGNDLYAGGHFTTATNVGGVALRVNRICKWNGTNWSALGLGVDSSVYSLEVSGSELYLGGDFRRATNAGGASVAVNRIARWNGNSWNVVAVGTDGVVFALTASGGDLYAGGTFTTVTNAGGSVVAAKRIVKWSGGAWNSLGSGMLGAGVLETGYGAYVDSLAVLGTNLYAAGYLATAGGSVFDRIARWDGSNWSSLGSKMNGNVNALAVSGGTLYAAGSFTTITNPGGAVLMANRIARWNGNSWSAVGSGLTFNVAALAASGNDIYAAGNLTTGVGGRVSRWNGTWTSFGVGVSGDINALTVSGTNLYIGGYFTRATNAGGLTVTVNGIAKWNGNQWTALGLGLDGSVHALVAAGDDLYAGGYFTKATNAPGVVVPVNSIAKWNGSNWQPLGSGIIGLVKAAVMSETVLYVGGSFTSAGEVQANRIASWNGSTWSTLGSGANESIDALALMGTNLFVGGFFTVVGGKASAYVAQAELLPPDIFATPSIVGGDVALTFFGAAGSSWDVERATELEGPWEEIGTIAVGQDGIGHFEDTNPPANSAYYRAVQP